jgi:Cu-Zn family superoxide dismutase
MKKIFWSVVIMLGMGVLSIQAHPADAICYLKASSSSKVQGWVTFKQKKNEIEVQGEVLNLTPGLHGFHIHEKGDCSKPDATSAGPHYNPDQQDHCGRECKTRHAGDLGNIKANKKGIAKFKFNDKVLQLSGKNSILGRSMIVHEKQDDFSSQPAGNAGARIACGVIQDMTPKKKK